VLIWGFAGWVSGRPLRVNRGRSWLALCASVCLFAACSSGGSGSSRGSSGTASVTTSGDSSATSTTTVLGSGGQWATYFGDTARSGVALGGPASLGAFRKEWVSPRLDGDLYAQPLLVGNRIVIATEGDSVYSLDASDGTIVWKTHLGEPVPRSSMPCGNVDPVGITSTPVVDPSANRIYVVGMVQPGRHMLFELDLLSGRLIDSVRVDADGADPLVHNQRAALALSNGKLFIPYGGRYGDCGDYHGRVVSVSVSPSGLGSVASYTLPTQGQGGFWAPPGAAVANDGTLYLTSGNSSSTTSYDYGNSVVRLSAELKLIDSFAPTNWAMLNRGDADLGSTGPVLLPASRVFQVGKSGIGYLLDAEHLGGVGGELHSGTVCNGGRAFGGIARDGNTLFVPCSSGIVQVIVTGDTFSVGWTAPLATPGPTIIAGAAVWTVATSSGDLVALDPASGKTVSSEPIGSVPSQFTSPAAGLGRVVIGAERRLLAFGASSRPH
jgi:outer membrane protein assembly factor BamB